MKQHKKNRKRRSKNQQNIGAMKKGNSKRNGEIADSYKKYAFFFATIILITVPILLVISALKNIISMKLCIETTPRISELQWAIDLISAVILVLLICRILFVLKDPSYKFQSLKDFFDSKESLLTCPIILYIISIFMIRPINSPGMLCGYLITTNCMFPMANKLAETASDSEYNNYDNCDSCNDVELELREKVVFALLEIDLVLLILGTILAFPIP